MPIQPPFYDWAFNLPEIKLAGKWNSIPDHTDILITHGPPKYWGDRTRDGRNVGSESLTIRIQDVKPKLHVFGHIHEARGDWDYMGMQLANVSLVNSRYQMIHDPYVFEVTLEDKK